MNYSTLDSIVRSAVYGNRLTIHYYVEFLCYALDVVKELNLDVLGNIKAIELEVNEFGEIAIPDDYIDYSKLGYQYGQYIINLSVKSTYNRLANTNDAGAQIAYADVLSDLSLTPMYNEGYWYTNYVNSFGEHLGKFFGIGNPQRDGFKVIPERGVIQLDVGKFVEGDKVILEYLYYSDTVATSLISPYAEGTIKAYCTWQWRQNSPQFNLGEVDRAEKQYYNELRKLRARKFKLTKSDILGISRKHFQQSPKL